MTYTIEAPHLIRVGGTVTFRYTDEEELLQDLKKAAAEVEEHLKEQGYVVHKESPC